MQQIDSKAGKLLYVVYQLYKQSSIDIKGKQILKDLIIQDNSQIVRAFDEYEKNGTQLTLKNDLFRIYKQEKDAEKSEGLSDRSRKSKGLKNNISIKVPPKNIQKIPAFLRDTQ